MQGASPELAVLTLKQAIEEERLEDFIRQEELRGVEPIDQDEFDAAIHTPL